MTTLAITPNWKNKSARFKGTVAAGEHVSVTIQNDDGEGEKVIDDASTLRLRVVGMDGRTLAIFPEPVEEGETPEAWGEADLTPLTCTLNLNTVQMLKAVPPAANVPLLWVLDDYENKTLYFKEQFPVEHWPRKFGEEEPTPTDLDDYKDIIEDFNTRLTVAEQTVATAATDAQNAAASASAAAASAETAATAATDAQTGAIASKNAAQTAADNAAGAKIAAETAQGKAEEAQEAAETAQGKAEEAAEAAAESAATFVVDDTLSVEGAAADAKAVGEANQDLITQIGTVQDNLDNEVAAREELDGAVQVDRQNLADEIARAQGAEQSLENRKADRATTYTKTEVDAKIAGVQTFQKYLVQTLPDADEADMKGLYLVPTGETSEEGDLCEEWTVVEEDGEKRWEKIGAKAVDLTLDDTVTSSSANGVKSSGIWSAIWGALSALPTGFTSLYDWVVSQLAGKASKADATLTEKWTPTFALTDAQKEAFSQTPGASDNDYALTIVPSSNTGHYALYVGSYNAASLIKDPSNSTNLIFNGGDARLELQEDDIVATLSGYQLGSQSDKPLASEAEAEALRTEVSGKANRAANPTPGNLAALDANGNPTDSTIPAANVALKGNIPYTLGTPIVIDTASSDPEGEMIYFGAATLADRTANIVQVLVPLDELRITFPPATSGKVRDFGLRVEIGTGSAALAAPALVPVAPTGETIKIENNAKEIPALADGTATAKGVTLLYFSENAPGVFVVKGEQVEEVA